MPQVPRIAVQRLVRANVVVHDLRETARSYARLLGIRRWQVRHSSEPGCETVTGSNPNGVTFRLVHPTDASSTYAEFLAAHGPGVHSLCVARANQPVVLDTRDALGGYSLEIASPGVAPADEEWDLSDEVRIPRDVEWLANIPRIGHFGIAVRDLHRRLEAYAEVLGIQGWRQLHFRCAPDSMTASTFNGRPVDNAWLLAITDVADFGLELLQETQAPTDYGETIARGGEGIHHVLVRRGLSVSEWSAMRDWMSSMNIGIVMSGALRAADFAYFDTRQALGFLLEVIVEHGDK